MRVRTCLVGVVAFGVLLAAPGAGTGSTTLPRLHAPWDLRVISYFPADAGWTKMWTDWQPDRVDADLARAASLDANTVRAIVQPDTFGFPHVSSKYAAHLAQFVSLAAAHGLHVQLTLFDWWYRWQDVTGSKVWAAQLLAPYRNDPRIAFVELRNEILPVPVTFAWARRMIPFVKSVLGDTPVTLSVSGQDAAARLESLVKGLRSVRPDFWDIHAYPSGGEVMYHLITRAQSVAGATPLWVGETGYPTTTATTGYGGVPLTPSAQEAAQAHFFATVSWAAEATGLPPVGVWVLDDMVPNAVPNAVVTDLNPELHFGLFRLDGSAKPAADLVKTVFSQGAPVSFNEGFEQAVTSEVGTAVPAQWSMTGDASFADDTTVAAEGSASARVALRSTDATASYSIVPPNGGVEDRTGIAVGALARRAAPGGSVFLVLEWLNASHQVLGRVGSVPLQSAAGEWGQLHVSARAPHRAAYARVELVVRGTTTPVWFDRVSFSRYY
ncbi:MAG: hypothetical protein E6G32_00205 [Actinobacteria bacterium]|nr:MAG: hypothetical protein E6G32_00205 [Actinomycetota bacterium]